MDRFFRLYIPSTSKSPLYRPSCRNIPGITLNYKRRRLAMVDRLLTAEEMRERMRGDDPRFGQPETYKFQRIGEPKETSTTASTGGLKSRRSDIDQVVATVKS